MLNGHPEVTAEEAERMAQALRADIARQQLSLRTLRKREADFNRKEARLRIALHAAEMAAEGDEGGSDHAATERLEDLANAIGELHDQRDQAQVLIEALEADLADARAEAAKVIELRLGQKR